MKIDSPNRKLDYVLQYLNRNHTDELIDLGRILSDYNANVNPHLRSEEMQRLMYKLVKDDYVWNKGTYYSITFEGQLYIGYEKQAKVDKIINRNHRIRTFALAWGTVLAGLAASALLAWQIYTYKADANTCTILNIRPIKK